MPGLCRESRALFRYGPSRYGQAGTDRVPEDAVMTAWRQFELPAGEQRGWRISDRTVGRGAVHGELPGRRFGLGAAALVAGAAGMSGCGTQTKDTPAAMSGAARPIALDPSAPV